MSQKIDLEKKSIADSYREEYPEYICSDDDARLTVVTFNSDSPDWLSHYDPTLTVDEHRELLDRAAREQRGGRRMDSEDSAAVRAGRAARRAQFEELGNRQITSEVIDWKE